MHIFVEAGMDVTIKSYCTHCSTKIKVRSDLFGKTVRCPACNQKFVVEAPATPNEPAGTSASVASNRALDTATGVSTNRTSPRIPPGDDRARQSSPSAPSTGDCDQPPPTNPSIGKLGRFELQAVLGEGGYGRVYRAYDPQLDRLVALKVPTFTQDRKGTSARRFQAEARAAAQLRHQNIVPIYDSGQADEQFYIAFQFVDGQPLSTLIDEQAVSLAQAVEWTIAIARALAYAHDLGIVHRDVKPHNVLLDERGTPQLTDFGLAKRIDDTSDMTTEGAILGTPAYMPPEQARGERARIGPRSDQYSLGVLLYEMLSGRTPFEGPPLAVLAQVIREEPPALRKNLPSISSDLEAICQKAMRKEPEHRYENCTALADDLERWRRGESTLARPMGRIEKSWRWCRRNPVISAASAVVALTLTIATVISTLFGWEASRQAALAKAAEIDTKRHLEQSELLLYAGQIREASNAAARHDAPETLLALNSTRHDLRGFEFKNLSAEDLHASDLILRGHSGPAMVACSPDGQRIASAGNETTARVFDATTGQLVRLLVGHNEMVNNASFSPDGRLIATCSGGFFESKDNSVHLRDLVTGRTLHVLHDHTERVSRLAFSVDSRMLASAGGDGDGKDTFVRVWDVATGRCIARLGGQSRSVSGVAFSADGQTIASVDHFAHIVSIWSLETGQIVRTFADAEEIAFSPDGTLIAVAQKNHDIAMYDVPTGDVSRLLRGHESTVTCVTFSLDGRTLASSSGDGTIRLWNPVSGDTIQTLNSHSGLVCSLALSANGDVVTCGDLYGRIRAWILPREKNITAFEGHTKGFGVGSFDPTGRAFVGAGDNGTVNVWDLATHRVTRILRGHAGHVLAADFGPNGELVASAGDDKTVRLWSVTKGSSLRILRGNTESVTHVDFSPDGRMLAGASGGLSAANKAGTAGAIVVWVWDVSTGDVVRSFSIGKGAIGNEMVRGLCFSPNGRRIGVATFGGVQEWDSESGALLRTLKTPGTAVESVAYSPDGHAIAIGNINGMVRLWNSETGAVFRTFRADIAAYNPVATLSFSPDGRRIATSSYMGSVRVWDVLSGQSLRVFDVPSRSVTSLQFSPDGQLLVSTSSDGTARFWDAASGEVSRRILLDAQGMACGAFSPCGRFIATGSRGQVTIWDGKTGQVVADSVGGVAGVVKHVVFSPDGHTLASVNPDKTVGLWDVKSAKSRQVLGDHKDDVTSVAFSPDGRTLASGSRDRSVRLWDTKTGRMLRVFQGHPASVNCVAFHPDGQSFVSAVADQTVGQWSIDSGQVIRTFDVHAGDVKFVAFSPDGRVLASAGADMTLRLWDATSGKVRVTCRGHLGEVLCAAFSPDGKLFASSGVDGSVRLWDAGNGSAICSFNVHRSGVNGVAFSPDGRSLMSTGNDGDVRLWPLDEIKSQIAILIDRSDRNAAIGSRDGALRPLRQLVSLGYWSSEIAAAFQRAHAIPESPQAQPAKQE